MSLLSRFLGRRDRGPEIEEVKALSDQFYITLSAAWSKVRGSAEQRREAAGERVEALLGEGAEAGRWSWNRAYEVEQQLVQLYDEASLRVELERRLLEAERLLRGPIVDWYRKQIEKAQDDGDRRAVLLRLINDIQWRYTVKEAARNYTKQITQRTGTLFILVMTVFVVTFLVVVVFGPDIPPSAAYLMLAIAAGLWGGAFSMLTGLKARLAASSFDELKLARSWPLMWARVLLGAGAAVVLYLFIRSGLLSGQAFPSLAAETASGGQTAAASGEAAASGDANGAADLALFTIWCFIAGFSEKLVPGLLSKAEAGAGADSEPPSRPLQPAPGGGEEPDGGKAGEASKSTEPGTESVGESTETASDAGAGTGGAHAAATADHDDAAASTDAATEESEDVETR